MNAMVHVKFKKLHDDVQTPSHGRPGDAGLDIYSYEDKTLVPNEQHIFKTGFSLAIPQGYVALIWDRSGMAAKNGVKVMGGVLDYTYRGEVGVVLINLTHKPYDVKTGDRIAQLLIQPIATAEVEIVDDLEDTNRGTGGFGSSGR
jgi:dUTP pyrophosphatase